MLPGRIRRALETTPLDATGRTRLLRRSGLYVPFRLARAGFPQLERERWRDLRAFRARYGALLPPVEPGAGETVLFAHLAPGILVTQVHAMFARAFAREGARPVFALYRDDLWTEEYLRACGLRDFVYVEDHLPDAAPADAEAARLLAACTDADALLALEERDVQVGRHAASRALKNLRLGSIDLSLPAMQDELRRNLARSLRTAAAARAVVDEVQPARAVVCEKGYTPWAEFSDVVLARGLDFVHWYRSPAEYSLLFRRYDEATRNDHFFSIGAETWARVKAEPRDPGLGSAVQARLRDSYAGGTWFARKGMLDGKRVKDREEILSGLGLDPAKKTAVLYSHVLWDATFWFGSSLFPDYGSWLVETVRCALDNPRVNWIIKMHPENATKARMHSGRYRIEDLEEYRLLTEHFPRLPEHVALLVPEDDTNPVSFFDVADWALTVRGTIGLELPCFGIPVLTAGTGGYSGRGFTIDSATVDEYRARLAAIEEIEPLDEERTELAQRFTNAVFYRKPIPIDSFTWIRRDGPLDDLRPFDFVIQHDSAASLAAAPDLRRIAHWALRTHDRDLLLDAPPDDVPAPPDAVIERSGQAPAAT